MTQIFQYLSFITVALGWISALLGLLMRRLSGLEAMFVVQLLFVCILWYPSEFVLPLKKTTPLKLLGGYNYPFFGSDTNSTNSAPYNYEFETNSSFFASNFNIMIGLQIIAVVLMLVFYRKKRSFESSHGLK